MIACQHCFATRCDCLLHCYWSCSGYCRAYGVRLPFFSPTAPLINRGAFDTVPEVVILLSFLASDKSGKKFCDILFDEAGHRVATQYLISVLDGNLPVEHLLHYREANSKLPGHPELGLTPGVKFSSGRLGHMWPLVNGVAMADKSRSVFCLGSDGSQQEGNDAEAARLAVAQGLNVKLIIDDNDVTIAYVPLTREG
jgi:transketolase N-terminal domain/subunit